MRVAVYNRLVRLRALVKEGFSGITVQLRRRADLIPNLVETVKGYATHERETLDQVIAHRGDAAKAGSVAATAAADNAMTAMLGRLFAVAEAYPELKADENFRQLQAELSGARGRASVGPPLLQRHRARPEHPASSPSPTCSSPARWGSRKSHIMRMPTPASRQRPRSNSSGPDVRCAFLLAALAALLALLLPQRRGRRRADPELRQPDRDPARRHARRHRDDPRPGRKCRDQPRHLPRFPDPLRRARRPEGQGRLRPGRHLARRPARAGQGRDAEQWRPDPHRQRRPDRPAGRASLHHPLPRRRG